MFTKLGKRKRLDQLTDYYFWLLEEFSQKLTYVCERPKDDIGCITGNGESYGGIAKRTKYGDSCRTWNSPEIGFWFSDEEISRLGPLQGNRYCRNPDGAATPWCLVEDEEYEYCDIPKCDEAGLPTEGSAAICSCLFF